MRGIQQAIWHFKPSNAPQRAASLAATTGVAVCVLLGWGTLAGCGGGDGYTSNAPVGNPLLGTWQKTGLEAGIRSVSCPNTLSENGVVVDFCGEGETVTFASGNRYAMTYPAGTGSRFGRLVQESGTYTLGEGSQITFRRTLVQSDANADGVLQTAEQTSLTTASGTTTANPISIVRANFTLSNDRLTLTGINSATTNANGDTIINGDGTVNDNLSSATLIFERSSTGTTIPTASPSASASASPSR